MRVLIPIVVAGLAVSACSPLSIYYRPGAEVSRMQDDATRCEIIALRDAPVANQVRQGPPIYYPGGPYCGGAGCYYGPGYWGGGALYTVDVNTNLRRRVMDMCMAEKGYQPVSLPRCSGSVARQVPYTPSQTLPALTGESCAIPYQNGRWQIVTPQSPIASE